MWAEAQLSDEKPSLNEKGRVFKSYRTRVIDEIRVNLADLSRTPPGFGCGSWLVTYSKCSVVRMKDEGCYCRITSKIVIHSDVLAAENCSKLRIDSSVSRLKYQYSGSSGGQPFLSASFTACSS